MELLNEYIANHQHHLPKEELVVKIIRIAIYKGARCEKSCGHKKVLATQKA